MPLYGFSCDCGNSVDEYFHMDDQKIVECRCGRLMRRDYSFSVKADIQPYYDHALGYVRNRKEKEQKMKEKGLKIFEPSEFKGHESYSEYAEGINKAKFEYKKKDKPFHDVKV